MHLPENAANIYQKLVLVPMNKHVMHAENIYASTRKCGLVTAVTFTRKGLLITMIKHLMEAARIPASTRKCGLVAAAKIHQERSVEYHDQVCNDCCKHIYNYQNMWTGCHYQDLSENECWLP